MVVEHNDLLQKQLHSFKPPVLVVSTIAGKGIYSIGEALKERFPKDWPVYHLPIEEMLPKNALREDYDRYRFISNNLPWVLYLVYCIPFFYYRKLFREKYLHITDLSIIKEKIDTLKIKTVICASHRPAFWLSNLKYQKGLNFYLCGALSEFGRNLGWKYILWDVMDSYFSPVEKDELDFPFPRHMRFEKIELPCQEKYYSLAAIPGERNTTLFVVGHWGQVFVKKARIIIRELLKCSPALKVEVVCGRNNKLKEKLMIYFKGEQRVRIHGELGSLAGLMQECGSIITKPGISTLLETHVAGRQIFLLKGLPVAEDNNARYAIKNYGARWFTPQQFKEWHQSLSAQGGVLRDN